MSCSRGLHVSMAHNRPKVSRAPACRMKMVRHFGPPHSTATFQPHLRLPPSVSPTLTSFLDLAPVDLALLDTGLVLGHACDHNQLLLVGESAECGGRVWQNQRQRNRPRRAARSNDEELVSPARQRALYVPYAVAN